MSGKSPSKRPEPAEEQEAAPGDPPPEKQAGGKKKLIILIAAPVLLIGISAGLWFSGLAPKLLGMRHGDAGTLEASKNDVPIFVDLPDMIANLAGPPGKPYYIKLQARLEIAKQDDADKVKQAMPRLQDMFQTYLREMRPEDLRGSAGIYRLREELLGRANVALAPIRVTDILFTQLLIQ
jgi:flagellar protein FliL